MDRPTTAAAGDTRISLTWQVRWEPELDDHDHGELADLLADCFPTTPPFREGQSWAGARPELRILGHHHQQVVAHAGVIRRFLRVGDDGGVDTSILVGDLGLVAVHPDHHRDGLGAALMTTVAATLTGLGVPYGFLTCGTHVRPFYARCGWRALTDAPVQSINIRHQVERGRRHGMLLAVRRTLDTWPTGTIHRDGQEI